MISNDAGLKNRGLPEKKKKKRKGHFFLYNHSFKDYTGLGQPVVIILLVPWRILSANKANKENLAELSGGGAEALITLLKALGLAVPVNCSLSQ